MENPFESGHIKNYVALYVSVVVIMVLFFIASTLFNDIEDFEKKIFEVTVSEVKEEVVVEKEKSRPFKLMDRAY